MEKKARAYQIQADNKVMAALNKGVSTQLCVSATGTGKTFIASKIARHFKKILFLCHREELIEQSGAAMLAEFYPDISVPELIAEHGGLIEWAKSYQGVSLFTQDDRAKFGVVKGDAFNIEGHITIASYQTINRRLNKINPDHFDLIICDEAHLVMSRTFRKSLDYFTPKLLLGFTATDRRTDGMPLSDIFSEKTFEYNIGDAIKDGYLVELDAVQVKTQLNLDSVSTLGGEFNNGELQKTVDIPERNRLLVKKWEEYALGKQTIVFCVNVEHAQNVCQVFLANGHKAEVLVGDTDISPDRANIIKRYKTGVTTLLINVDIATTGFDDPLTMCLILARPTKSWTLYMQVLGRGTRTLPGVIDGLDDVYDRRAAIKASAKPHLTILDIVDVTSRHRIINTVELDKKVALEDKLFMTSEKKQALFETRRISKLQEIRQEDKKVNLFAIPDMEYSNSPRMQDAATDKQLAMMADYGYDIINNSYTKAMANVIISSIPATPKQIGYLRWKGYDVNSKSGITYGEFQLCIKEIQIREAKQTAINQK